MIEKVSEDKQIVLGDWIWEWCKGRSPAYNLRTTWVPGWKMVTFTVIGGIRREASVTSEMSSFEDMLTLHYLEYLGGVVWQVVGYINLAHGKGVSDRYWSEWHHHLYSNWNQENGCDWSPGDDCEEHWDCLTQLHFTFLYSVFLFRKCEKDSNDTRFRCICEAEAIIFEFFLLVSRVNYSWLERQLQGQTQMAREWLLGSCANLHPCIPTPVFPMASQMVRFLHLLATILYPYP